MKMQKSKGFTLIELMVVIAIIGVLMAIALPQYQRYTIRAKASQALNAIRPVQLAVAEYAINNRALPTSESQLPGYLAALTQLSTCNGIVKSVSMDSSANLTATFYTKTETPATDPGGVSAKDCMASAPSEVPNDLAGLTIVFTPLVNAGGAVTWQINTTSSTVPNTYLPNMPTTT